MSVLSLQSIHPFRHWFHKNGNLWFICLVFVFRMQTGVRSYLVGYPIENETHVVIRIDFLPNLFNSINSVPNIVVLWKIKEKFVFRSKASGNHAKNKIMRLSKWKQIFRANFRNFCGEWFSEPILQISQCLGNTWVESGPHDQLRCKLPVCSNSNYNKVGYSNILICSSMVCRGLPRKSQSSPNISTDELGIAEKIRTSAIFFPVFNTCTISVSLYNIRSVYASTKPKAKTVDSFI